MTAALVLAGCFPELPPVEPGGQTDAAADMRPVAADEGPPIGDMAPDVHPPDATPSAERCNGVDDDLDGPVDEGFALGMPCTAGQGVCSAEGSTICSADGAGTRCDATPGAPATELCNGLDDDCSGVIDEGFVDLGAPCTVGEGPCASSGVRDCSADGRTVECGARPAEERATPEVCNAVDDDCDGAVDEALVRSCASGEVGLCAAGRQQCVDGQWAACMPDRAPDPARPDTCNGRDDDCDLSVDEDDLPDGAQPCNPLCDSGIDGCIPTTPCVEQCYRDGRIGVACAPAPEELCDGRDDDCDGAIDDDGVCGSSIVETCTFAFGWTTQPIESPAAEWGDCDFAAGGIDASYSCNGTRDDAFAAIDLPMGADIDQVDDRLGVALRCGDGLVGQYIAETCRVVIGVATEQGAVADGGATWGPCPEQRVGGDGERACTSSTADGDFLPLPLSFDLAADTFVGVAFVCDDPEDPQRAAALQTSVAVSLGWADSRVGALGDAEWQAACAPLGDGNPYTGCAVTQGDGRFRLFRITADVDGGDRFAIRLAPIEP